ncbi:hypothetical protein AX15_006145 [Amanita polypyramis BW_CC]|nr:hypothetical protein AX15_006145 [Amanita polypyramis BW_CC]
MPKPVLYIKGYKLDRQKIRAVFKRKDGESEESYDFKWIKPIINSIPETPYSYVGNGLELDGHLNLVLVLEDGYDEAALGASDVQILETLPQGSLKVLTAGV